MLKIFERVIDDYGFALGCCVVVLIESLFPAFEMWTAVKAFERYNIYSMPWLLWNCKKADEERLLLLLQYPNHAKYSGHGAKKNISGVMWKVMIDIISMFKQIYDYFHFIYVFACLMHRKNFGGQIFHPSPSNFFGQNFFWSKPFFKKVSWSAFFA